MHNTTNDNGAPPPSIDSYVAPLVISAVGILFTVLMISLFFFTFWWHYLKPHQSSPHANTNRVNLVKNSVGVPEGILKKIRIITYLSPPHENQQDDSGNSVQNECSICLGTFDDEEKLRVLPNCRHAFHVPCIDAWFEEHTNCPICRSPIDCDCESESSPPLPPTDFAENSIQQRVFHVIQIDNDQSMDNEFQQLHSVLDRRHSHSDSCCHYMMKKKKPPSLGMRLKRSLSLDDQSSLYVSVTIQRDHEHKQEQEEVSTSSSSSSSSSSTSTTSNTKGVTVMNRYKSKSLKHHMSMVLMRSFSTRTSFSGILPN